MIVTLAGHVDHGKSAVVRALTGIDTDRLQEEKAKGLTIDLGFAYTTLGSCRVGFIDVPGHHQFIHNMIAGVGRNQHALLIVSADDGVMPQTIEHLQILTLLGLRNGTIVINKCDRADSERLKAVRREIELLVEQSFLSQEEPIEVSATTGLGINRLRQQLAERASAHHIESRRAAFRMAIDRAFSLSGVGAVVTGTVFEGATSPREVLVLSRSSERVRVRSIHVQNERSEAAGPGDRVGINLAGVSSASIQRGEWLIAPETALGTKTATILFKVLADYPRAIKPWLPIHLYHLTSHTEARIAAVGSRTLAPGNTGLVDAALSSELHLKIGDAVIARTHDLNRTIGGGEVVSLDRWPRRRNAVPRQALLCKLAEAARKLDPVPAIYAASAHTPIEVDTFGRAWNLLPFDRDIMIAKSEVCVVGKRVLRKKTTERTLDQVLSLIGQHHAQHPDQVGCTPAQLLSALAMPRETVDFALAYGISNGKIKQSGGVYALPEFRSRGLAYDARLFQQICRCIETPHPLSTGDIAKSLQISLPVLMRRMLPMLREGVLIQISQHRILTPTRIARLREAAQEIGALGPFSVADFRTASGLGRNASIQFLEYLDRRGVTRRVGDVREILRSSQNSK